MKVAINTNGLDAWFNGDTRPILDLVRLAEAKGVDQVNVGDHVAMGEDHSEYPFGEFGVPLDFPWNEPLVTLSAIAGATSSIRLSSGVLITPLRPAVLLAKQLATLDVVSGGRLDIGFGVGWQKAEYDACGVDFATRAAHMEEQVRACKLLWSQAPASFQGDHVRFEAIHARPFPVQNPLPIWFGISPGGRNLDRIARLGDGWLPLGLDQAATAAGVARIKALMAQHGRDPDTLAVRHLLMPVEERSDKLFGFDNLADQDAALATASDWFEAGVTMIEMFPTMFCRGPDQFENFIDRLVMLKERVK